MTEVLWYLFGYCIFMWVLVFILFFTPILRGAHPRIILHAPILPFWFMAGGVRSLFEYFKMRRIKQVSTTIVRALRQQGITVNGEFGVDPSNDYYSQGCNFASACDVRAELELGQEASYAAVYAQVILAYGRPPWRLTPADLCRYAHPADPLDEAWANQYGFTEYFATQFYVPCADCGAVEAFHSLQWGDKESHAKPWHQNITIHVPGNPREIAQGHICQVCLKGNYSLFNRSSDSLSQQ